MNVTLLLPGFAMAGLMVMNLGQERSVSPVAPQTLADHAWRELWLDHWDGNGGAIELLRAALAKDPAFPYRWADLGNALAGAGESEAARECFQRSVELAPHDPEIGIRAMNFHLATGEKQEALRLSSAVLNISQDDDRIVFAVWQRFGGGVSGLRSVLETNPRATEGFFRFLLESKNPDAALVSSVGNWMQGRSLISAALAKEWAAWLSQRHRDEEAQLVWKRHVARDSGYGLSNAVDNAGFEEPPGTGVFDWRVDPASGFEAGTDRAIKHSGDASLRIAFDGSVNLDFHHVAQRVWLTPGRYKLTAWIRTENISTDQGVGLGVESASTPVFTGSHDWTRIETDILVGKSGTRDVQVIRRPSLRFDNRISGAVWIDDVELRGVR